MADMEVTVIGGGLAGSEAAWQLARRGIEVKLYEMRPLKMTPVHQTGLLAELVCSNSLKSDLLDTAQGLLKAEMRLLGSLILDCAEKCRVPAGSALAVDRYRLGELVTDRLESNPLITVIHKEVTEIPDGIAVIATGPLTGGDFGDALQRLSDNNPLFFYDAVAPIVTAQSVNMDFAFRASRYGKGTDDYINCPLDQEEYTRFYRELVQADEHKGHDIDDTMVFEGCMPIEVMARRGLETLRYGPMRPVGFIDPRTGRTPYAVLQLRQEDMEGNLLGLVGFQTRLRWGEQERVFRLIPALKDAEFVRFGVMHRNTYINSPQLIGPTLQVKKRPQLFIAGQITGVEGYMESAATGIWAGINAARLARGLQTITMPRVTMLGSLLNYISSAPGPKFSPMNANFGLLPPLEKRVKNKKQRYEIFVRRSLQTIRENSELFAQ